MLRLMTDLMVKEPEPERETILLSFELPMMTSSRSAVTLHSNFEISNSIPPYIVKVTFKSSIAFTGVMRPVR